MLLFLSEDKTGMLKTTSLGRYWQDNSDRNSDSFTRVRCISTGAQATSHVYGSFLKTRACSVPDATPSIKKLQKKLKKHSLDIPLIRERETDQTFFSSSNNSSEHCLHQLQIPLHEELGEEIDRRLLVCTLDTEQNERNLQEDDRGSSEERTHSLTGSVDFVTTTLTNSTQPCRVCGNCLEYSDMVVIFEKDTYHVQCFKCGQCGKLVDPANEFLVLEDGSPLCQGCSPACHACGEKIVSCHVNVLNKDFHEECLKCSVCKKVSTPCKKYSLSKTLKDILKVMGILCYHVMYTRVFNEPWHSASPYRSLCYPQNVVGGALD